MNKLLGDFKTTHLIICQGRLENCEELASILESWEEQEAVTGRENTEKDYFIKSLTEGHLPPNGIKENSNLMTIKQKENNQIIGFLEIYHGYPNDETIWIGLFIVAKNYRSGGIGKEVIEGMVTQAKNNGWSKLGIGVYLKNWQALKFWTSIGFDRITSVRKDKGDDSDVFVVMGLEKSIK